MEPIPLVFDGPVAEQYDDLLGPFVFEPFALDMAARVAFQPVGQALELAAGTGRLTRHLLARLPGGAHLTATDLNAGMLAVAQARLGNSRLAWATVDVAAIPYAEASFDLVACQFGVMFAPDKARAFAEMYRVLRPGGRLVFNTWGPLAANPVWSLLNEVVALALGANPAAAGPGPFAMQDEQAVLAQLTQTGFRHSSAAAVCPTGQTDSAATAARGFVLGSPLRAAIEQRDPTRLPQLLTALETAFAARLGNHPLRSPLHAWVFEATK